MLRLSRLFLSLSEFLSDVNEWGHGKRTWKRIRGDRWRPPEAEWKRPDTSRAPFRLPPDIEDSRGF